MAAVQQPQRRLVHKQFNSPLGLYSQQNVQTVLDQHIKTLDNGTVGIDFKNDLSTAVPASLQKSAVLRALEEEERQKKFEPSVKRVAWPPPPDFSEHQNHTEPSTLTEQLEHHKEHYQHLSELQNQQQHQLQQKQQQAPLYQPQATQAFRPVPAPAQAGYQPFQQKPPSPVRPRVVSQSPTNQYPGLITQLRKEAPITQQPSPVFQSQPAAATLRGGSNMRGDQKWPPVETKQQIELENEARRKLAQGPAFRPKRAQKDYTQFFAKNALNNTYPGYRVPPGTQHVGTSE
uniref:CSON013734 protein n=1 Tax=Culicoides sonorensis TaxID=179676 RepID=A0A336KP66_CULSO